MIGHPQPLSGGPRDFDQVQPRRGLFGWQVVEGWLADVAEGLDARHRQFFKLAAKHFAEIGNRAQVREADGWRDPGPYSHCADTARETPSVRTRRAETGGRNRADKTAC